MTMTNEEIVREYRAAKSRMKQIGILADENGVDSRTIVNILIEEGQSVPGNFLPRRRKTAPRTELVELEPRKESFELKTETEPEPAGLTAGKLMEMLKICDPNTRIIGIETISVSQVYTSSTGAVTTVVSFG